MGTQRADRIAQVYTEEAFAAITEVMNDPFAEDRDRLRAAEQILDRGHGKPISAVIQLPPSRQQAQLLASMSDDELERVVQQARLPSMFDRPIDGEFTEVPLGLDPLLA